MPPMPQPKQVLRSAHFLVLVDEQRGLIHTSRTSTPFATLDEVEAAFAELRQVLDGLGRARYALFADIRAAPGRNDPQFEAALQRLRPLWIAGFRKVGVLVQSAVGKLQISRYARQDGIPRLITDNEDELLKYLLQEN